MGELTANVPGTSARRDDGLADLCRAESAHVVNLAYLLSGQRQLAEDLAQESRGLQALRIALEPEKAQ